MNILIAGYGFVGQAHQAALKDTFDVTVYDPAKGHTDFGTPQGIIICVSTPAHQNGSCNFDNIAEVIGLVSDHVPILIKSTVSVEGWRAIQKQYPQHRLAFSPEFLRAASAVEDFLATRHVYMGGDEVGFWHSVFRVAFNDPNFITQIAEPEELILAKYFRNSFLATKVAFFNQVYDLCESTGVDYAAVKHMIAEDSRIGHSHTEVTEARGYGGHCFPKDTAAIVHTGDLAGVDLSLIKQAADYNHKIRKE